MRGGIAPRASRRAACGRVARSGEILFRSLNVTAVQGFFHFTVLVCHLAPYCAARSVEYSRTLPRCAACKTRPDCTIIRKMQSSVLVCYLAPYSAARSVEYSRTLPSCAACKTRPDCTIIRKMQSSVLVCYLALYCVVFRFCLN